MDDFRVVEVSPGVVDLFLHPIAIPGEIHQVSVASAGTELVVGQECVRIETLKVNLELCSPVAGTVLDSVLYEAATPTLLFAKALLRVQLHS